MNERGPKQPGIVQRIKAWLETPRIERIQKGEVVEQLSTILWKTPDAVLQEIVARRARRGEPIPDAETLKRGWQSDTVITICFQLLGAGLAEKKFYHELSDQDKQRARRTEDDKGRDERYERGESRLQPPTYFRLIAGGSPPVESELTGDVSPVEVKI